MFKKNPVLLIIALIAVVNALGYGIIIPILYSYTHKFGLSDFQTGLLFSAYSAAQLVSTPIIGKLSDKFGRKPLLVISILGTALSFLLMAVAQSGAIILLARILDGITAGNIPVASAVISDTTDVKDRARGFGLIGAAFGFGFVFGPAISALTVGINIALPFFLAAGISLVAVIITVLFLPETHKHRGQVLPGTSFHLFKLVTAVADPRVGLTLFISLLYSFAFSMFILVFQPYAIKVLHMTPTLISVDFTLLGVAGLIAQALFIPWIVKKLGDVKALTGVLVFCVLCFAALYFNTTLLMFIGLTLLFGIANSSVGPLVQVMLSKETDHSSQGSILGLNTSYISVGTILGPLAGGVLLNSGLNTPFLAGAVVCALSATLAAMHHFRLAKQKVRL